jgi:serine/threonine-protein kinase HipA
MNLDVLIGRTKVGILSHDTATNRYAFTYSPEWLQCEDRFALSPALPLEGRPDASPEIASLDVRQFFENLLPEGPALDIAASVAKVSKSSLAGLLATLGRETAGALRILPPEFAEADAEVRRPLTRGELSERIRARPYEPFSVWDGKIRLSMAGFQDKVAVYVDAGQWYLVEGATLASTHILKPEPIHSGLRGLVSSEFFCMRLATAVGISAAPVELVQIPERVLAIRRFDRTVEGATVRRIHTIDGAQALGLAVSAKYERPYGSGRDVMWIRDGASLPKLFALLESSATPLIERRALLRWAIFQVLIDNADAHAKNLSFFVSNAGVSLAPAYDLVSMHAFASNELDRSYAMAIGDAFSSGEISPYEWSLFAESCGLPKSFVAKELSALALQVEAALDAVATSAHDEGAESAVLVRITAGIAAECVRQRGMAAQIR